MNLNDDPTFHTWSQSFFEAAMWNSPDAVIVTTAELDLPGPRILYANPAFCEMTGYEAGELLGKTPRILQGPDTDPRVLQALRASLIREEPFIGSTINYRKDGTPYQVEWSTSNVKDKAGGSAFFVSFQRVVNADSARLQHMEVILRAAPVGMMLTGPNGIIETANGVAEQIFGYSPDELKGQPVDLLVPDQLRVKHAQHRKDFAQSPQTRPMMPERELQGQRQDGSYFPLEVGLAPINIDGVPHTLASVGDVSEQKHIAQSMAFHARLQTALAAFGRAGLQGASLDELYRQTVELTIDVFAFEAAVLVELGSSGQQGNVVAGICSTLEIHWPDTLPLSSDPLAKLAMKGGEYAIGELPPMLRESTENGAQSIQTLCIPVQEPDRCWGLLYVFRVNQEIPDECCLQGLAGLTHTLASATRRERDQRDMHQAAHLRSIAGQMANLGSWSYDPQSKEVHWSDEVCGIHELPNGYTLTREEGLAFYLPKYRQRIASLIDTCAQSGKPFDEEAEIVTAKGNQRLVRVMGACFAGKSNEGGHIQGAFQDITDQRRIEQSLAQSQEQFRQLADAMPNIVWTADAEGRLDYANRRFQEVTGIYNEALPGKGWIHALHPGDELRCKEAWYKAVANQENYSIDLRLYHKRDHHYCWYRVSAVPVRNAQSQVYRWYGSALNIHDRKVLEEELTQSANMLTQTLESITDGFFTLDRHWQVQYFNLEAERLLATSRDAVLNKSIWNAFPNAVGSDIESEFRKAMVESVTGNFEYFCADLDTWLEIHAYPTKDGLTVYFRDITERKQSEDQIEFLAFHDPLTHLPNRRLFQKRLDAIIAIKNKAQTYAGVMLIDLDHFKVLNDTWGHGRGDQLLSAVARRLESFEDEGFYAARLGGDEFTILIEHLGTSREAAIIELKRIAERVRALIGEPLQNGSFVMQRTCSIGVTLVDLDGDSLEEVMKRLDLALYDVKHRHRNAVGLFDPALQAKANLRAWLESSIPAGIQANEFMPYYQPKMNSEGRCVGAEALVRWHHPERGIISPAEFIPFAEETGLIGMLGESIFRKVCEQIARWSTLDTLNDIEISVNVSARQFHESGFVNEITTIINETGIDPKKIQLEVTETLLLGDLEQTVEKMNALRSIGISFSLDDFGTGYSSLAYLKQLPLDVLKIDQSFIQNLPDDSDDVAIVQTIIALAGSLGLEVLAEGVEEKKIQDFLMHEGCHAFQGYLYSRPLPADEFERYQSARKTSYF
ncbi:EAL domain-containing protein [Vreelandella arcis]|uniref:cyclic-guanylate-specific phosphodiesterase n=1 Tax=Vreelandella arcis TaxID=416873 RepID=A0A1H0CST4_9GAMM|nr:EAL domain-containing protein [Halomonas arcis]SDN60948.1 PAS domain S-box-containing protein/diguanylate cyclase (GGDEF) domain-containing protein [Halomonas arcis]